MAHGTAAKRVRVAWPGGGVSVREGVTANRVLEIRQGDAAPVAAGRPELTAPPLFADVTAGAGVDFTHRENPYGDFHHERLLPYQLSRLGPHLAGGDVNGDGREDFFVGAAAGQPGRLYLQAPERTFVAAPAQPWAEDAACEDMGSVFFDADRDGDADLYVVSGGNEFALGSPQLQDRLYLNDGHGTFAKAPAGAIPAEFASGGCVTAGDYDRDGDPDLFVGGRIKPGAYPDTSPGGILRNDTDPHTHRARFTVATPAVNPALREPGLVTDARWTDVNGDGWPDLLVVGEWMPVRVFINQHGKLVESRQTGLEKTGGLWAKILPGDFDGDGDTDYVLGNMGANLPWKASAREPLTLYADDFDGNGRLDPVLCAYVQGVSYPVASHDELLDQINPLRKNAVRSAPAEAARAAGLLQACAGGRGRPIVPPGDGFGVGVVSNWSPSRPAPGWFRGCRR